MIGVIVWIVLMLLLIWGIISFHRSRMKDVRAYEKRLYFIIPLGKEIELYRLSSHDSTKISGGGGLFGFSIDGRGETRIQFSWQSPDGNYYLTSLPTSKICVNFIEEGNPKIILHEDKTCEVPDWINDRPTVEKMLQYHTDSATILCKREDWQPKFELV